MKNEYLKVVDEKKQRRIASIFGTLSRYEDELGKPIEQFTAREFLNVFVAEFWTKPQKFRDQRSMICDYLAWLENEKGVQTNRYQFISLTTESIPNRMFADRYFFSLDDIADALVDLFPNALHHNQDSREMLCLTLNLFGLTHEIINLRESDIDPESHTVRAQGNVLSDVPERIMQYIVTLMHQKYYELKNITRYYENDGYVLKHAQGLSSDRTVAYIKDRVRLATKLANERKKKTKWAKKSLRPKDLSMSYLFCQIYRYEQETGDILGTPTIVERRGKWLTEKFSQWILWDGKIKANRDLMSEYLLWKNGRDGAE